MKYVLATFGIVVILGILYFTDNLPFLSNEKRFDLNSIQHCIDGSYKDAAGGHNPLVKVKNIGENCRLDMYYEKGTVNCELPIDKIPILKTETPEATQVFSQYCKTTYK